MAKYAAGFYHIVTPFDEPTMRRTLAALHGLDVGFFPADLFLSHEEKVVLNGPDDYARDLIPAGYFISPGVATLPLESSNGVHLVFTETDNPRAIPGSLVLQMTDRTIAANGWTVQTFLRLFRAVITAFGPDYGYLYDESHAARPAYTSRMFDFDGRRVPSGLFWINYYGPEWARNVGVERLERLRSAVPVLERLDNGGVLVAIQEAPYDEGIASHRENQQHLEELLGLRQVQASLPNPGL